MKKLLLIFSLVVTMAFSAQAANYVFTPGMTFIDPNSTYTLDVALTLEYMAGDIPFCYTGSVVNNTETEFNNIVWTDDTDLVHCEGRAKPSWSDVTNNNATAHNILNQFSAQGVSYVDHQVLGATVSSLASLSSSVSGFVPNTTTVGGHALSSNVTLGEGDITNLTTDLNKKPAVKVGSSQPSSPIIYINAATTTSGAAVFYLTSDATSSGTALCANGVDYMKAEISDAASSYNYSYAVTNSNKTLTVTAKALGQVNLLSTVLLTPPANAANGTNVSMFAICH